MARALPGGFCVELVAELAPASFVDTGCGSGLIAIAAALSGYRPVTALDVDPAAFDPTLRNAGRERRRQTSPAWGRTFGASGARSAAGRQTSLQRAQ